jgi:tRNA/tmRNA/rRNA uracil-C5-methylase (TrmA/RlmC/RlmD family)
MTVAVGDLVTLTVEKPAAGGRMIARKNGQVVLVAGAIPGERLTARIERLGKGVAYAQAVGIEDGSPDRRPPFTDPLCGGCLYAHIAYPRQLEIKSQVIADAFTRIGRIPLSLPVAVAASRDDGYRMRARLHVRGGRAGFFREGTHEICDARATRQLLPETCDVLDRIAAGLRSLGAGDVRELEVAENLTASQRAVHLDTILPVDGRRFAALAGSEGLTGLTLGADTLGGTPKVIDVLTIDGHEVTLGRHVLAFFQGNRYLLRDLVTCVVGGLEHGSEVVDLYAGVGLFAVPAAAARGARVKAVEGDRVAAMDLEANARATAGAVQAIHEPVEAFVGRTKQSPDVLIVDPPRTGMSREALDGAVALRAAKVVYVSCDVATLARDSRRVLDAGYTLTSIEAFDLFPNTPHVEMVAKFRG